MKTLHTIYTNFAKRFAVILTILMTISINNVWAAATQYTGEIIFGNSGTKINAASVTGDDNLENTWTIITVGTTSYTPNKDYSQVGSGEKPATTITFTTTLSENYKIVAFSAKFGGFSNTEGAITLKVGDIEVGTGSLNGQTDVTIENSQEATGKTLTVAVTGIYRAVKCYSISYTYESISQVSHEVTWRANGEIYKTESLPEGNMTLGQLPNKPSHCNNNIVFVGWTAQQEVNVTKPADLFNSETPGNLPMINKPSTFYAVYAEMIEGDGSFIYGSNGEYKIYANVNGTYHYAKERADNGLKITSTTTKANAGTFIFDLHNVDGNLYYTIQFKDIENQYIYYSKSTDLELRDEPYYWNIVPSSQNKGTWRVTSVEDSPRSIIYQTNSFNTFGGYDPDNNITADGNFYDLEIGNGEAISYQNYTTTCTTDVTVTLDPNGGTGDFTGWDEVDGNYTQTVEKGNSVTLPTLNDQTVYTFGGWSDGTTTHNAGTYTPETDVELTAVWTAKPLTNYRTLCTYNIEYTNLEGATHTNPNTYTAADLPLTFTTPSAREGYTFKGWEPATLSAETRGDQVVEAQWTVNQYTVIWKLNGGQWQGGGTDDRVNNHNYGAEVTKPVDPSRTGYTFTGWSPAEIPATMPAENLEFTAQWTPTPYTVTWMLGGTEHATSTVNIENPLSTAPDNPSDGDLGCCADKFMGWSSQQSPSAGDIFTEDNIPSNVTTDKIYYAVFATAAQGVGTSIADFSEVGYVNATRVTEPIILGDGEGHGDATITFALGSNVRNYPKYYTSSEAVHIYQGNTITIASTYHIKSVAFNFATGDGSNEITANSGTYVEGVWTENVESPTNNLILTIGGEAGQHRRIASITVTTGVSGSQYTNYVTKCTLDGDASLGNGTITYYQDGSAIAVNCQRVSAKSTAATLTFQSAQKLTCPITLSASEGFLLSTNKEGDTYAQNITVTPYKSGTNVGKLKNVYVRADATNKNDDYTGTITVTGGELNMEVSIDVSADVTCQSFIFKTLNHLGEDVLSEAHYAGDIIENAPDAPQTDDCSENYTFDGWSTSAVEYGSLIYNKVSFPYTMPNHDVILYPVYQVNPTADYHRVTSDLGAENWAGDYLIAAEKDGAYHFADGYAENIGITDSKKDLSVNDNIVSVTEGDDYFVKLIAVDNGYVLQSKSGKYNYINENDNSGLSGTDNISTAMNHPLTVAFDGGTKTVSIANMMHKNKAALQYTDFSKCFRFYEPGNQTPIYLYKKSPLYTSYLACGTISVSKEDVYVTATEQRGIRANQPLTVTANKMYPNAQVIVTSNNADVYFSAERNANFAMAAANQPQQSLTLTANEAGELSQSIYIHYRPSSEGDGVPADVEVTAKSHNLPISDNHTIHVRNLPAKFVIATKVGAVWYALPANMTEPTNPSGVVIEVDETNMTAIAPTTTTYTLWPVKTTNGTGDRYQGYGECLRFASVNYGQRGLWANDAQNSATIRNYAVIDELGDGESNAYEWKVTTTVVDGHWQYTLKSDQEKNKKYLCYCTSAEGGAKWGTYESVDNTLYLLPMTEITEMNVEVMEWGTNSMALRFEGDAPANVDITLGKTTTNVTLTNLNSGSTSDIYKVEGVALTTNDGEVLKIVDNTSNNRKLLCKPILVTGESVSTAYSTLETTVCDVVVLNGGKLSAGDAHVDFANIYVYPGGKLILDGKSLGVKRQVYLRGGYSWLNPTTYALPEVYLNGSVDFKGSGNIIYDYYIQNYKYYQFSLPYKVPLANVTDEAGVDDFPVWVKHYNGALRAVDANATSWEWYYGDNFEAGIGYIIAAKPRQVGNVANRPLSIIRFPLGNRVISSAEADKSIATTAHGIDAYKAGTITANNVGWNFIGNPFMATWKGDIGHQQLMKSPDAEHWNGSYHWENNNVKYITVMSPEDGTDYDQYIAAKTELKPFFPFYLQETADGGTGTINFAAANRIQKAPAMLSAETPREAFVQIEITAEGNTDQTGMFIGDRYSDDIDFDDYEKMFGSSTDKPKVWLMHEGKRMAFEAVTESTAAAYTAIGYRAPQTGKYMFAINEEASKLSDVEAVYLTDNQTGVTDFDLLSSAYEFESNGELYNDSRFTIRIVLRDESPGTTTGVGNLLHFNSEQPMKFIYQDKMYILRNGVIYDAMGKQVQTINK